MVRLCFSWHSAELRLQTSNHSPNREGKAKGQMQPTDKKHQGANAFVCFHAKDICILISPLEAQPVLLSRKRSRCHCWAELQLGEGNAKVRLCNRNVRGAHHAPQGMAQLGQQAQRQAALPAQEHQ